jgi:hypothetical protein
MCITIVLVSSALFFVVGFKAAEYILKGKDSLQDQDGNDLDKD